MKPVHKVVPFATCGIICGKLAADEGESMPSTTNHWSMLYPQADQQRHALALARAIERVCASGSYILGAEVEAFEGEFAAFLGINQVTGVASGTDAIELILRALGIGAGSKVAVPSFAPSAVAAGVARSGAEPEFADIEPDTFTLCPEALAAPLCSPRGRGVKLPMVWVQEHLHPMDLVLMVLASRSLEAAEYICDYDEFACRVTGWETTL
jgi:hypothetical protein